VYQTKALESERKREHLFCDDRDERKVFCLDSRRKTPKEERKWIKSMKSVNDCDFFGVPLDTLSALPVIREQEE
jgi:hypothetical protein